MAPNPTHEPPATPAEALAEIRRNPGWTDAERDAALDRLVERFPAGEVVGAARDRLHDLGAADAEAVLRLVEAFPSPELGRALAGALGAQPDLPPDRAWDALAVLDGMGLLADHPGLAERWDELNEGLDDAGTVEQLVGQIEEDPEGLRLALDGLSAVEPGVRVEIVSGLGAMPMGPGLAEFLRLLAYAHDGPTRAAAVEALANAPAAGPERRSALADLAARHPDPAVAESARRALGGSGADLPALRTGAAPAVPAPRVVRSLVTGVDGRGRGTVVLSAARGGEYPTAAFLCDVERGVVEVVGDVAGDPAGAAEAFEALAAEIGGEVREGAHGLALGLLAGALTLCGPGAPPALRYWVEATTGPDLRPRPFPAPFAGWDPAEVPFAETPARALELLRSCPDWLDDSPLTYELAEEIQLRYGGVEPDPRRDAGAYRFLFEHRLLGRLEHFRRMLLWTAGLRAAGGDDRGGRSAVALAWQLSDPQHVVPGHPFTVALTTRSLAAAMADLARGVDPRKASRGR